MLSCAYIELWMHLGSLESTQEASVAFSCASRNSFASLVLSKLLREYLSRHKHAKQNQFFVVARRAIQHFPATLSKSGFFKVSEAGIDFAVPFPRLLKDLPENKDLVTVRTQNPACYLPMSFSRRVVMRPCITFRNTYLVRYRSVMLALHILVDYILQFGKYIFVNN